MFIVVFISCIITAIVLLALAIYLIVCAINARRFVHNDGEYNIDELLSTRPKFNIPLYIALRIAKKVSESYSNFDKHIIKKMIKNTRKVCYSIGGTFIGLAVALMIICAAMYIIENAITTSAISTLLLFGKVENCTCYVKCSGDSSLDSECTYKSIFGEDAYNELVNAAMIDDFSKSILEDAETGQEKGILLISCMNINMVNQYRSDLASRSSFRDDDLDRDNMTDEQLMNDLIKLLSDYKVDGKNPTCDCSKLSGWMLTKKCLGVSAYTEPWTFVDSYTENIGTTSSSSYSASNISGAGTGSLGYATGNYTIQTSDGLTYYWYHQSANCACANDVVSSLYGRFSAITCGIPGASITDSMAVRGCSIYSTSMALSCLLDQEITPYVFINQVLHGDVKVDGETKSVQLDGSYGINNTDSSGMKMDKSKLAGSIVSSYGNLGLKAMEIGYNQSSVDEILNKGGVLVFSVTGKDGKLAWYSGSGHFIVIRKKEGDLYYCLNSIAKGHSSGNENTMNIGLDWDTVKAHIKNASDSYGILAIWRETSASSTVSIGNTGSVTSTAVAPVMSSLTDADVQADVAAGRYTLEDYNYLVALGGESSSYDGFYAVACCVRNRVNARGQTYKQVVTASGQFSGYHESEVGNPRNDNVRQAAIMVLRGGPSTIGDAQSFFGRINGHDIWADPTKCTGFTNIGGNVFYSPSGSVHNKKDSEPSNAIIIYNATTGQWNYPSGCSWSP